ncbi:hypothetical protein ADUPG1_013422 [Aduncisulcus paluster]|uniref:Uncharacterized protein n=1 Tax=Aduncisulcus paluster TaxID=2918883 RepID=A0ABQ5K646_9EUKA|nr:hypothetical protein ADUPG1_013422 [Aduncisulcus paluster]
MPKFKKKERFFFTKQKIFLLIISGLTLQVLYTSLKDFSKQIETIEDFTFDVSSESHINHKTESNTSTFTLLSTVIVAFIHLITQIIKSATASKDGTAKDISDSIERSRYLHTIIEDIKEFIFNRYHDKHGTGKKYERRPFKSVIFVKNKPSGEQIVVGDADGIVKMRQAESALVSSYPYPYLGGYSMPRLEMGHHDLSEGELSDYHQGGMDRRSPLSHIRTPRRPSAPVCRSCDFDSQISSPVGGSQLGRMPYGYSPRPQHEFPDYPVSADRGEPLSNDGDETIIYESDEHESSSEPTKHLDNILEKLVDARPMTEEERKMLITQASQQLLKNLSEE